MSTVNQILKMIQLSGSKLAFRTCFSSVSFNGYKLDILKSAVQKYLRRREFHKMVWCVGEIYLFQVYAKSDTEKRATKGIISNLLNRLIIMLDEEMLFAECEKYLLVRRYMEDFEKSNRGDFECLFKICDIMCGARMIRRNSDIRSFWSSRKRMMGTVVMNIILKNLKKNLKRMIRSVSCGYLKYFIREKREMWYDIGEKKIFI